MTLKNFFEFNLESLKLFLNEDLEIDKKKVSMRSKQIWQSVYKKGSFEINNLTPVLVKMEYLALLHMEINIPGPNA